MIVSGVGFVHPLEGADLLSSEEEVSAEAAAALSDVHALKGDASQGEGATAAPEASE